MTDLVQVDLLDFVPSVLLEVSTCPEDLALKAVRDTCIDFCDHTNFWQHDLDPITAVANVAEYELDDIPTKTALASIVSMTFQGLPVYPRSREWLDENMPSWREQYSTRPDKFLVQQIGYFQLVPYPSVTVSDAILVRAALKPSRTATQVYDRIYEDYLDDIANGALGRLLAMQSRPWSNADLALYYKGLYELERGSAKIAVRKGHTQLSAVVAPRCLA